MATNPFEDEAGMYLALVNTEGQYSLWPAWMDVPDGWTISHEAASRSECLEYIEQQWVDMRPRSLVEAMEGRTSEAPAD